MGDIEVAVSKRKPPRQTGQERDEDAEGDARRRSIDTMLAGLFRDALETPIPEDMLRLVRLIGARKPAKS